MSINNSPADLEALNKIYAEHADRIFTFCKRLLNNREDAEDLAAEVFLQASKSLHRFEGRAELSTYLYRIALNLWKSKLRRRQWNLLALTEQEPTSSDKDFSDPFLEEALGRLPAKQRVAVLLVKAEGMSYADAAQVLQVPLGTVQSRVFKGLQQLRRELVPAACRADIPREVQS